MSNLPDNLNNLSEKNLIRVEKVLRVVLDELELGGERMFGYRISVKILEREGVFYDEAISVLNKIDCVKVRNWELRQVFNNKVSITYQLTSLDFGYTEKDLDEYIFLRVKDLYELKKITKEVKKRIENKNIGKKIKDRTGVKKITMIELKNGRRSLAINDNYNETREIKDNSESWQIFIKEIQDKNIRQENRTGVKDISDSMRDYFNYNENCPIYMGGKYALTEIIIGRDIRSINPEIKTKIISEKRLLTLQKKKNKKT